MGLVRGNIPNVTFALGLRNLATGAERTLADDLPKLPATGVGTVRFSPTSEWVGAKVSANLGDQTGRDLIVVARVAPGAPPIMLPEYGWTYGQPGTQFTDFQWSPDGAHLAYLGRTVDGAVEVHVLQTATRESRPVGRLGNMAAGFQWSPSGRQLAMLVADVNPGGGEIRIVTIGSGESRTISVPGPPGVRTRLGIWTAGNEIARRQVDPAAPRTATDLLLNAESGRSAPSCTAPTTDLAGGFVANWSWTAGDSDRCLDVAPTGAQLVWRAETRRLMIRDHDQAERPLTTSSGEEYFGKLSPDGRFVVFASNRDGGWGLYAAPIARTPVSQPLLIEKLDDLPSNVVLNWTNDGFTTWFRYNDSNIWRVQMDPATGRSIGSPERLTQDASRNEAPSVSADGQRIAYWSRRSGNFGIALMDANGANERIVSAQPAGMNLATPFWRSNDELLIHRRSVPPQPGQKGEVFFVRPSTGASTPVVSRGFDSFDQTWQFVPTRNAIVYLDSTEAPTHVLKARSLTDGTERVVASFRATRTERGEGASVSFRVSPDGWQIAYLLNHFNYNYVLENYDRGDLGDCLPCEVGIVGFGEPTRRVLREVRAQGRPADGQTVAGLQKPVSWSPDGRFLLLGAGQPRIMDTATGESWPLVTAGQRSWDGTGSWSPDGSFIVFSAARVRNGIATLWDGITADRIEKLAR